MTCHMVSNFRWGQRDLKGQTVGSFGLIATDTLLSASRTSNELRCSSAETAVFKEMLVAQEGNLRFSLKDAPQRPHNQPVECNDS